MKIHIKCPWCDYKFNTHKMLEVQCGECDKRFAVKENID